MLIMSRSERELQPHQPVFRERDQLGKRCMLPPNTGMAGTQIAIVDAFRLERVNSASDNDIKEKAHPIRVTDHAAMLPLPRVRRLKCDRTVTLKNVRYTFL